MCVPNDFLVYTISAPLCFTCVKLKLYAVRLWKQPKMPMPASSLEASPIGRTRLVRKVLSVDMKTAHVTKQVLKPSSFCPKLLKMSAISCQNNTRMKKLRIGNTWWLSLKTWDTWQGKACLYAVTIQMKTVISISSCGWEHEMFPLLRIY